VASLDGFHMQRIIFLNRFFFPDHSATSQILSDLAFQLATTGREVHVITSRQSYDNPQARLPGLEYVKGVHVHRLSTTQYGRSSLPGRALDYASFYAAVRRAVTGVARPGDILVVKTDPPLLSVPLMRAARRRRVHLINWLQDIFPEVAVELGVPFLRGPVGQAISVFRDASLKSAAANVVLGARMAQTVLARGVPESRVHIIHNWSDDEQIRPVTPGHNPLRQEWRLEHKFILGYSGNLGRAHEYETVLGASERLRDRNDIVFLFVGGGHLVNDLKQAVKARNLDHKFRFMPYQDQSALAYLLAVPDIHWVSLRPELEGLIVPSKFYGIAAAGRPVMAISAAGGEIAGLVQLHKCGVVIEPGNSDALAAALVSLSADRERIAALGMAARNMIEAHFTRRQAFDLWQGLLSRISHSTPSGG
jgi:glycosyltransferase involved in cell wall biosynthesis